MQLGRLAASCLVFMCLQTAFPTSFKVASKSMKKLEAKRFMNGLGVVLPIPGS